MAGFPPRLRETDAGELYAWKQGNECGPSDTISGSDAQSRVTARARANSRLFPNSHLVTLCCLLHFFFFFETDFLSESASLSSPLLRTDPAEHCTRASPSASPILQTPEEFGSLVSLPVGPLFRIFGIARTPPRHDPPGFRSASLCFRHLSPPGGCSPSLGDLLLLSSPHLH